MRCLLQVLYGLDTSCCLSVQGCPKPFQLQCDSVETFERKSWKTITFKKFEYDCSNSAVDPYAF